MDGFAEKRTLQNEPGGEALSSERLDAMSAMELADALELALDSMTEENYDPQLIDAYLDALNEKTPMPEAPDAEKGLQELQNRLQVLAAHGETFTKPQGNVVAAAKRRSVKKLVVTVAATVALLLALMMGAQAAGIDVFGNLARWTDDVFFFIPSSGVNESCLVLQRALAERELPKDLAPTWLPDGFTAGEPEFWDDWDGDGSQGVGVIFSNEEGRNIMVDVDWYSDAETVGQMIVQKDPGDVELYTSNDRTFYILSNVNVMAALWSDGNLLVTIHGKLSVDELKMMIDSMGG